MSEPKWLLRAVMDAVHDMQLEYHGGLSGTRDAGLLESALARPVNAFHYGEQDLCALAASYAFGMIKNHPYIDGNKRAAFLATFIFLDINGLDLITSEVEATTAMLALAGGEMGEEDFTIWLRNHTHSRNDKF